MISRRHILVTTAALPLAACATGWRSASRPTVKIVTLNIWHDAGGKWPTRLALIVDALRAADADVIALQEVLQDSAKNLPNQAETIAAALGGYSVHFMSTSPEGSANRYGNAILTRLPVVGAATKKLEPLNDYRTAIRVRLKAGSSIIDFANTHLAWQPEASAVRAQQINDLLDWLPKDGVPLIIAGDFNAPLSDEGLLPLRSKKLESALAEGATATTLVVERGHQPRVIDHIFFEKGRFAVTDARVIADKAIDGEFPSDHFGVEARFQLL